jgi:hypothetical protein
VAELKQNERETAGNQMKPDERSSWQWFREMKWATHSLRPRLTQAAKFVGQQLKSSHQGCCLLSPSNMIMTITLFILL